MTAPQVEFLVEEASMEACVRGIVPRIAPATEFDVHSFRGKADLLAKLPRRLAGYRTYGVAANLGSRASYRDPDAVRGGTWEALERELRSHGHPGGLEKIRAAKEISANMDIEHNRSASFCAFRDGLRFMLTVA